MRGKLPRLRRAKLRVWITPARAGKTRRAFWNRRTVRDHPRACGENSTEFHELERTMGSPPRVRGKLLLFWLTTSVAGITPARAGKTPDFRLSLEPDRDHPRACGENNCPEFLHLLTSGSPPRVRGKHPACFAPRACGGITPARAGKTYVCVNAVFVTVDHPRACGENRSTIRPNFRAAGSPPRVRGKPIHAISRSTQAGITPARAGKTFRPPPFSACIVDHPRACGENPRRPAFGGFVPGSPPRVRGKLSGREIIAAPVGITPARAGKTRRTPGVRRWQPDHPRACGENTSLSPINSLS